MTAAPRRRPAAVVFDALGTLFDLAALREPLAALGLPGHALELWYARTLRDGFALAATGAYQPFRTVAAAALAGVLADHGQPDDVDLDPALDGFATLPPYPDAAAALAALDAAGVPALVLSNGSASVTRTLLCRGGLLAGVTAVVSIDDARAWKPHPAAYRLAERAAAAAPGRLALVAAHAWDCHGAQQAGWTAGWVRRAERRYSPPLGRPDAHGTALPDTVAALLALPAACAP